MNNVSDFLILTNQEKQTSCQKICFFNKKKLKEDAQALLFLEFSHKNLHISNICCTFAANLKVHYLVDHQMVYRINVNK